LTFSPSKKVATPLIRVEKNFFEIGRAGYQKKRNFSLISKIWRILEFGKGKKFFYRKTEFLAKNRFFEKKSLGTS
jgi:hypothetical protein